MSKPEPMSKPETATRHARFLRGGALLVLVCLALMEILLRISAELPLSSATFVHDPGVGYRMRPGIPYHGLLTSSSGFHDLEPAEARRSGVERLAFIGDSFVAGAVVRDELFTTVVEDLARRSGWNLEVLNMGIPAAGPENYLGLLRHDAVAMNADRAGIVFFVGNDVEQSHPDFVTRIWFGAPRMVPRSPFLLRPSTEYVASYRLLRGSLRLIRHRLDPPETGTFSRRAFLEIERQRMGTCRIDLDPFLKASYQGSKELFERMRDEAAGSGIELFVVLAPDQFQVDPALRSEVAEAFGLDLDAYDFAQPQRILTSALEELGIPALDLLPDFQGHSEATPLYLFRDTHWNREGNRLAAERIVAFLHAPIRKTSFETNARVPRAPVDVDARLARAVPADRARKARALEVAVAHP